MPQPDILDDLLIYGLAVTCNFYNCPDLKYEFAFLDDHLAWFLIADRPHSVNILIKADRWQIPFL